LTKPVKKIYFIKNKITNLENIMGKIEQKFSSELQNLFSYIVDVLNLEYPTKKISIDYMIVAILDNKKSHAYALLNNCLMTSSINELRNIYGEKLKNNSCPQFYKNKENEIQFNEEMEKIFQLAQQEFEDMGSPYIGSEHVLLAILNQDANNNIVEVFKNIGVDYTFIKNKCNDKNNKNNINEPKFTKPNALSQLKSNVNAKTVNNAKTPFIEQYTINLNQMAKKGEIDELIGREKEIEQIIKVLARRKKNNVILVGKSGVGKTQIVYGIANLINQNRVPEILQGKELVMINITALVSGTHFRGMFEERVNGLFEELKQSNKYILFIDDMQTVLKSSNKDKDTDISSMIGNVLSEGHVRVIGTVNFKDYRNAIESNTSIARKLQKLIVEPTTIEETIQILEKNKSYYEEHHKVKYSTKVIETCVKLSDRYVTERSLPDSAFDVLDLSGAKTCLTRRETDDILEHRKQLELLNIEKNDALNNGNFEFIDSIEERENFHKREIANLKRQIEENNETLYLNITEENIMSTISEMTNVPIDKLQTNDKENIANIDNILKEHIIGQDEAIDKVCRIIKRNKVGLGNKAKTRGNLLLIGKSGTGKTLLAKKIAEKIYGSENDLIRIDMSEFSEKSSVAKLTGAAPGYIGYENGGQLTEAIKHKQHCVLLLDEIEKADKEVYNLFLQLFDEGRLTDSSGQIVNFKNVLVLMTSNVGTKQASEMGKGIGFTEDNGTHERSIVEKTLKKTFTPEFLNRLDQIVYFNSLSDDNLKNIVKIELKKFINRLNEIEYNFNYDDEVIDYLHSLSIKEKEYGARPILRLIQNHIEDEVTDLMLQNEYETNYTFNAKIENGKLQIN
jgi:ATP-dependent Clp protease ATP-binding subunit ClpC